MIKKLLSFALVISFFSTINLAFSEDFPVFIAARVGSKIITGLDVYRHLEYTVMSEDRKALIFSKCKSMYEYEQKKLEWLKPHFMRGLKDLVWYKVLQFEAKHNRYLKKYNLFKVKEEVLDQRFDKLEKEILKPLMKDNTPIEDARKKYAERLIKISYPHRPNRTLSQIYYDWSVEQKKRIYESIRMEEARKVLYFGSRPQEPTPGEMRYFYNNEAAEFNRLVKLGPTTEKVIKKINERPTLKLVAKKLIVTSMAETPSETIVKYDKRLHEKMKLYFTKAVSDLLNEGKINRLVKYERISHKLAKKYKDPKVLRKKEKESLLRYYQKSDYTDLMMAKLYNLASSLIEKKLTDTDFSVELNGLLQSIFSNIKGKLNKVDLLSEKNKKINILRAYKNLFSSEFNTIVNELDKKSHMRLILKMSHWVLSFDIQKIGLKKYQGLFMDGEIESLYNAQHIIKKYLYRKNTQNAYKKYRLDLFTDHHYLFRINPKNEGFLSKKEAMKFMLPFLFKKEK